MKPAVAVQKFHTDSESSNIGLLDGFSDKLTALSLMLKPNLQAVGENAWFYVNSSFPSEVEKREGRGPLQLLQISGQILSGGERAKKLVMIPSHSTSLCGLSATLNEDQRLISLFITLETTLPKTCMLC